MDQTGIVFNVQRFTIHDGPGVRTEFFLKGCPLRCQWCSNPESWALQPQVGVYRTKCIGRRACGACDDSCPQGEIFRFTAGRLAGIDRTKCSDCLVCAEECPSDALKQWGRPMKVEECMEIVRRDRGYYERSGGESPSRAATRWCRAILWQPCSGPAGRRVPYLLRVHLPCRMGCGGKNPSLHRPHHL
ncbi:4Fe-4S binding protein [Faecalibacterium taiwanense]|uniref:4Fe-4S binding protein n=1 Tax=Faecalibacterium taiwanense TaxID=3030638 RepID=UPI003219D652